MSKKFLQNSLVIAFLLMVGTAVAQIQHGGQPLQWHSQLASDAEVDYLVMPKLEMEAIVAEDLVVDQYKETPYRFGMDLEVDYNIFEEGTMEILKNGDQVWRLGIHCPDATSINFIFGEYVLPEGATVYIWSGDRTEFIGALTSENNKGYTKLAVGLVHSDKIVIEYRQPVDVIGQALLSIEQISHGYRPVINKWEEDKGPFGTSGSCNMNVNCDDGEPWQAEKRGVALILNGGNAHCTGSLINNTNQDGTPYFLTAAHCDANESNWVFYFNHEYEGCANSGPADQSQSISGATQIASTAPSDAHLVELSSNVPESYDPYYNGWDNSGDPVSLGIGIHHPSGDVKKLAFDDDPLTITQYLGTNVGNFDHWRIELWERQTTTEGGSSGSPLFDQNHRIIGQLHGGYANCQNSVDDYYGAMHTSFPFFSEYLDPTNTGVSTLDGYGPYDVVYANDAQALGLTNLPNFECSVFAFDPEFELKNNGTSVLTSATISYSYNGVDQTPISWTGSLAQNESEVIPLVTFNPITGENDIEVTVTVAVDDNSNNNTSAVNFSGEGSAAAGVGAINVSILPDNYGSEITWELKNGSGVSVLSGGPYTNNNSDVVTDVYIVPFGDNGCYEFIINDTAGDGVCCGYGEGSYTVTDADGTVLASGAEYDDSESSLMAMEAIVSIDEVKFAKLVTVYPNPADNVISIDVNRNVGLYTVKILNVVGQTVMTSLDNSGNLSMDISTLTSGVYFIEVAAEANKTTKKVVVK